MIALYLSAIESEDEKNKIIYIYNNYHSIMCFNVLKFMNNPCDVEDIVHSAMLKIIDNIAMINTYDQEHTKNLCCIIARQKAINFCKARDNRNHSLDEAVDYSSLQSADPGDIVADQAAYDRILDIIDSMSDTYRDVCRLKYVYKFTEKKISECLNLSPTVVNQRIMRGKKIIRDALIKEHLHE